MVAGATRWNIELIFIFIAGKDAKEIEKAVIKAVSRFHSKKKKAKNPKMVLKKKATAMITSENTKLWCPK